MECKSRIVYIGTDNPLDLSPMIPYIERLAQQVPAEALTFNVIPETTTVDELESMVRDYVAQGYNYVGMPTKADLIEQFLTGNGGSLGGIPVTERWPNTLFMVQDYSLGDTDYDNVFDFTDINSLTDDSLMKYNLTRSTKNAGRVYVVYQGNGEPITTNLANQAREDFREMGIQADFYEVGAPWTGQVEGNFDEVAMRNAANDISMSIPPHPADSTIIHIVRWFDAEKYTQEAIQAGLFSDFDNRVSHYSFQNEYYPIKTPLPVDLQIGRIPVIGVPSMEAHSIGVPLEPGAYYSFPYLLSYLDSYLWAANCGRTNGINDKQLKFDRTGTRISYFLADYYIPKGTLEIRSGPLYFNPRWFNEDRPVVPTRVRA